MTTKVEAQCKIFEAIQACNRVHSHWVEAHRLLGRTAHRNNYGIYDDKYVLNKIFTEAKMHFDEALETLDAMEFPTDEDYEIAG